MLRGSYTALVTPFKDGVVEEEALKRHVSDQIDKGTDGLVPCGTTGESATLTHDEHKRVIDLVIEGAGGRVPVIAGTGSNSTKETITLTRHAEEAGADCALLITPYYNKPTQDGLYEHYLRISESVDLPLMLYNVPGRTSVNMLPETVARLSELKNVVGIKEATGSLEQASAVLEFSEDGFLIFSGDDFITLPLLSIGAEGAISVTSNILPAESAALFKRFFDGDLEGCRELHYQLQGLNRVMFLETNPLPVKTALAMMGRMEEEFRLPLTNMKGALRETLEKVLNDYGLLDEEN